VVFADSKVWAERVGANRFLDFGELAKLCFLERVSLSATGFYKTPDIHWDPKAMRGHPFFYFSYGAAVAEVVVDTLTGEHRCLRADLVQDCGRSLNPAVDRGQIEGAFVQGMGWLTCEELWWDAGGRLRTVGPSTYKIPGSRDVPPVMNLRLLEGAPARVETIFRSKAVGEPPLLLATCVWNALKDAIGTPALDLPATPERVLMALRGSTPAGVTRWPDGPGVRYPPADPNGRMAWRRVAPRRSGPSSTRRPTRSATWSGTPPRCAAPWWIRCWTGTTAAGRPTSAPPPRCSTPRRRRASRWTGCSRPMSMPTT
jgi:hypothetical protein